MERLNKIKIIGVGNEQTLKRLNDQLRTLILTTEKSIPGSRGFGLSYDFLDQLPMEMINEFAIELEEKVDEFIPDISISSVEREEYGDGSSTLKIYVERRDEGDAIGN